jgi:hypothetical protein
VEQAPADLQASLQSTGEPAGGAVRILLETDGLERLRDPRSRRIEVVEARVEVEVLPRAELRVEGRLLEHDADLGAHPATLAHHVEAEQLGAPRRRRNQGREDAEGGGLARTVGSQQAEEGALRHLEVEAIEGAHVPVALDQPPHQEGRLRGRLVRCDCRSHAVASAARCERPGT